MRAFDRAAPPPFKGYIMKKTICFILAVFALLSPALALHAGAINCNGYIDTLYSECYILLCTDNDEVLFSKDINKQTKPASLTKIVTACVILDEVHDLSQTYTIPSAVLDELVGTDSSVAGLRVGESYTIYDLLCCLLIPSANDAANALAAFLTGNDRQAFVDKMNALAEELGCENTHFINVHGLDDDDHYTTVSDMAKFLRHAMKYSEFKEITSMTQYKLPATDTRKERLIRTTNYTIVGSYKDYYNKYIDGGKTGYTKGAGQCLAVHASNNGYNYIAVAMNGPKFDMDEDGYEENGAFVDCKNMLDFAFKKLRLVSIADASKIVGEVPVKFGRGADYVTLSPSGKGFSLMPAGVDAGSLLIKVVESSVPDHVTAPVKKGDVICKGAVYYADEAIADIDLVASTDIRRSMLSYLGTAIVNVFSSSAFKLAVILIVGALITLTVMRRRGLIKSRKDVYNVVDYNDYFDDRKKRKK